MKSAYFSPAVPVHTYQRIVEQIERAILSGDFPVGSQLPSERDLMVQFDVSRPTIRESLRVLQSMGLIESRPGTRGGPVVLAPSPKVLGRSFRAMLGTDAVSLAEIVQFRIILEGSASSLAAFHRSAQDLERLREAIETMEQRAEANAPDFADADLQFHETIWRVSGNTILLVSGQAVSGTLRQLMHQDAAGEHNDNRVKLASVNIDRGLFEAIERQDPEEAGRIARISVADRYEPLIEDERHRAAIRLVAEGR